MQIIGKIHEGHCANEVFLGTLDMECPFLEIWGLHVAEKTIISCI